MSVPLIEIATQLGIRPRQLRAWMRQQWPRSGSDRFAPWLLSGEQVALARSRFGAESSVAPLPVPRVRQLPRISVAREALRLRAQADRLLTAAGITRNATDLVGQLAELLVAKAFDGQQGGGSQAGYDVLLTDGRRVQVKSRIALAGSFGKYVFMRGLGGTLPPFDELIYVQFEPDYELDRAVRFEHTFIMNHVTPSPHTNSWRLIASKALLAQGEDITAELRAAFEALP